MGEKWYLKNFRCFKKISAVGEASTQYFYIKKAAKRIYEFNPDFKLIFILRNPVERIISNYKREIHVWGESRKFEDIMKLKSNRYLWASLYYTHLTRFFNYFPIENLYVIVFEKFILNPEKYLKKLCAFLNINPNYNFELKKIIKNPSKMPISVNLQKLNKKFFYLNRREPLLIQLYRLGGNMTINSFNQIFYKSREFPRININSIDSLKNSLIDEVKKLEDLINEDLSIWKLS